MSTTWAYLRDCEEALLRAKGSAHSAAADLVGSRQTRVLQLIEQLEQALSWAQRIEFYVRADELASNPHGFAAEMTR
jgi:hypothetical protein